jgi:tetratricopeptide (TPR) repeat protein
MIHFLLLNLVFGQTSADLYNLGNKYFAEKDFQNAIASYEQAVNIVPNARIYYNLGNAYFKANKMGMAIICYRRALFLSPRDPDIFFNLKFNRNFRIDKNLTTENLTQDMVGRIFRFFSLPEASFLAAFFFLLSAVLISMFIVYRRRLWLWIFIPGFIVFLFVFISSRSWIAEKNPQHSVITLPEVSARSGPADDYKEILVIHDGTEVRIQSERGEYYLIQLPGGLGGWVRKSEITRVY